MSSPSPAIELTNLNLKKGSVCRDDTTDTSASSSVPPSLKYLSFDNRNRSESIEYETIDSQGFPHHLHATIKNQPSKTIGKIGSFVLLDNNLRAWYVFFINVLCFWYFWTMLLPKLDPNVLVLLTSS
jgi:hypothetical protein